MESAREELLDDDGPVLRGKVEEVTKEGRQIKHKLLLCNAGRLIEPRSISSSSCSAQKVNCTSGTNGFVYHRYKPFITLESTITRYLGLFGMTLSQAPSYPVQI